MSGFRKVRLLSPEVHKADVKVHSTPFVLRFHLKKTLWI